MAFPRSSRSYCCLSQECMTALRPDKDPRPTWQDKQRDIAMHRLYWHVARSCFCSVDIQYPEALCAARSSCSRFPTSISPRLFGEKRIHQEIKQALLTHAGTLLIIISLLFQLEMYNYASIKLAWGINNNHNQPYIAYDKMIIKSLCVWLFFFSAVEYSWLLVMMSLISPAAIILLLLQY